MVKIVKENKKEKVRESLANNKKEESVKKHMKWYVKKEAGISNIKIVAIIAIVLIIVIIALSVAIGGRKSKIDSNQPKVPWQSDGKASLTETIKYLSRVYTKPGTFKIITQKPQWGEDGTASVKIQIVGDLPEGANPQYSIDGTNDWKPYSDTQENILTGLKHKDAIAVKIYHAKTKVTQTSFIHIKDRVKPQAASISLSNMVAFYNDETKNITAQVTHNDNESGIDMEKSKWVYNTIAEPIGTNETDYTGGSFSENEQTINWVADKAGNYYLHVLSVDKAGNKVETVSSNSVDVQDWDRNKVYKASSEDKVTVPVPIGFVPSTINGEKKVEEGFVIKQGDNGALTEGINEFVWVPVPKPEEMFTVDNDGNPAGQLYDFGTSSSPKNPAVKRAYPTTKNSGYREPDVITGASSGKDSASGTSYDADSTYLSILGLNNATEFKTQLQNEFNSMMESVKRYKGFYIGRYETGDLSKAKAVVQKNNSDINKQNWYTMYQRSKVIVEGTKAQSTMIWGCQWDACLRWMQTSSNEDVKNFPTNSEGNYAGTQGDSNKTIPTGSNDSYKVNNIYDMAGNVYDWTIEADHTYHRVRRRGPL